MKCTISVKDEVWCRVAGLTPTHTEFLWKQFAVFVDGYFFMPSYRMGRFDGKIRFFDKTGKTYVRLLEKIIPYLETWGYDIDLLDSRAHVKQPKVDARITKVDAQGIAMAAEGLNIMGDVYLPNGQPFTLRPYQLQAVLSAVEHGSGFCIAGTGAGKCVSGCTQINIKCSPELAEAIENVKRSKLRKKDLP